MLITDITPYRKYVDSFDLTEEQKIELVQMVWNIMESFVDRAFGVHSVQLAAANNDRLQELPKTVSSSTGQQCSGVSKLFLIPGA